jgi:sec-independent protein translocase protein TatA
MLAIGPFGIGPMELVLLLAIVIIIFGVGRLPEVGGAIGRGIRDFRKASRDAGDEAHDEERERSLVGAGTHDRAD